MRNRRLLCPNSLGWNVTGLVRQIVRPDGLSLAGQCLVLLVLSVLSARAQASWMCYEVTTDKTEYLIGDEVHWTLYAGICSSDDSESDGLNGFSVDLNETYEKTMNPPFLKNAYDGIVDRYIPTFLSEACYIIGEGCFGAYYNGSNGFEATGTGTRGSNGLKNIGVSQYKKVLNKGKLAWNEWPRDAGYEVCEGVYTVTEPGVHQLSPNHASAIVYQGDGSAYVTESSGRGDVFMVYSGAELCDGGVSSVTPQVVSEGDPVTITCLICNQGQGDAVPFTVRFYSSANLDLTYTGKVYGPDTISSDTILGEVDLSGLAAGQTTECTLTVNWPAQLQDLYHVGWEIVPGSGNDLDYSNNQGAWPGVVATDHGGSARRTAYLLLETDKDDYYAGDKVVWSLYAWSTTGDPQTNFGLAQIRWGVNDYDAGAVGLDVNAPYTAQVDGLTFFVDGEFLRGESETNAAYFTPANGFWLQPDTSVPARADRLCVGQDEPVFGKANDGVPRLLCQGEFTVPEGAWMGLLQLTGDSKNAGPETFCYVDTTGDTAELIQYRQPALYNIIAAYGPKLCCKIVTDKAVYEDGETIIWTVYVRSDGIVPHGISRLSFDVLFDIGRFPVTQQPLSMTIDGKMVLVDEDYYMDRSRTNQVFFSPQRGFDDVIFSPDDAWPFEIRQSVPVVGNVGTDGQWHMVCQGRTTANGGTSNRTCEFGAHVRYEFYRDYDRYGQGQGDSNEVEITVTPKDVVLFPDPNLEAAVRSAIGKAQGTIYRSDVAGLRKLTARSRGITNLTGLERCTNLTTLTLDKNQVTDLTPLCGLTGLTELSLASNSITDITPLEGLTQLDKLSLLENQIAGIISLQDLTCLKELRLSNNQITDISSLQGLTGIEVLTLSSNQITDISPLRDLTSLEHLGVSVNQIADISPLQGLATLEHLDFSANQVADISPLQGLTSLKVLHFTFNHVSDITVLSGLIQLETLSAGDQITDITALQVLARLSWLSLFLNPITDIQALVDNTGLGQGDRVELSKRYLTSQKAQQQVQALRNRGVSLSLY